MACALLRGVKYGYISEVVGGPTVNRPSIRRLALPPLLRGALVVVIGVGVSTCRIGEIINAPASAILVVTPAMPSILQDSAPARSTAARVDTIGIKNEGGGELHWRAHVVHANTSKWVRIQPDSGIAGDGNPLRVFFLPDSVDPAVSDTILRDTVIVESSTAGAAYQTPLQFTIHRCRDTQIPNAYSHSDVLRSADCGAPHATAGQYAQLFSFQRSAGESTSIILTPATFKGVVALDTAPFTPGVAPLATKSDCNGDATVQCIYYFSFPRSAKYYIEVTGQTKADSGSYSLRVLSPDGRVPNAPDSLSQRRSTDSAVVAVGDTVRTTTILFRAVVSDSDAVDTLHLEAEAQFVSNNFTGTPTAIGQPVLNGQPAWVSQSVISGNSYHWCVRVVDQSGRGSTCLSFGGNPDAPPAATDFVVKTGNDPRDPTNLKQLQSDGSTTIVTGQTANGTTVVFQGDISDPDAGNTVLLEVEVQPIDSAFTDSATVPSTLVPNPSTGVQVTVNAPKLVAGKSYHWQARTVDNTGLPSAWVPFGGNSDSPLPAATDFNVQVLPTNLVITVQPNVDTSGRPIHPSVQVAAKDQNNNTVQSFHDNVAMAITQGTGTAGATLFGTNPVAAVNGVATFTDLSINKSGSGYKLQGSAVIGGNTITSAPSSAFNVLPGSAAKLSFSTQPTNTVAGQTIAPVVVAVQDTAGNTDTSYSGTVTLGITPSTGKPGATLNGTKTVPVANGLATFSTLSIDSAATGYSLTATSTGLASATSAAFAINPGSATTLRFTVQPQDAASGAFITPAIQVTAFDVKGNLASGFAGNVTMAITSGTGKLGAHLLGTNPKAAVSGVATFSNLSIDSAATGYTLTATATGLTSATSSAFAINPSNISPTLSQVAVNPSTITASSGASTTTITVTALDGSSNPVPGATVVFSANPTTGNTLTPTSATTNGSGVATATLSSTKAEIKTVSATISGVNINQTQTVTVNPAPLVTWVFSNQPSPNTTAGAAINAGSGVGVTGQDQFQNTVTGFTSTVTMAVTGPGTFAPTSTNQATAVQGVATFPSLRIYTPGSGYKLQASGGSVTGVLSNAFTINAGAPTQLAFTTPPASPSVVLAKIDSAIGGVVVKVQDSVGNTVPFGGTVRIVVGTDPAGGTTLSGGAPISAPTGVATFQNLTLNKLGTGFTLLTLSASPALISDESPSFNIVPGPATTLVFTGQPTDAVAGARIDSATGGVKVTATDAHGFTATSFTGNVTVAIGANPGGGTLGGTRTVAAIAGIATFTTLNIDKAGVGYTLTAAATGLTGATSNTFNITTAGPDGTKSTLSASPLSIVACKAGCSQGAGTASVITVTANDALGNPVQGATVVLSSTGSGYKITQPSGPTGANGVATGTITDTVVESQTISATITLAPNPTVNVTQTATVNVTPSAATTLFFTRQPGNTVAGAIINPVNGVQVEVRDQFGNKVTSAANTVGIAILNNPGGGTLVGTLSRTPSSGTVTFNDLSINKTGSPYTLVATSAPLTSDTSSAFTITPGTATKLGFVQQPTSENGGVAITPAVTVEVEDVNGNRVTSAINNITVAIGTNPNNGTLGGVKTVAAVSGLATFSNLSIDSAGVGYTLAASAAGLTGSVSSGFTINVGPAAKLGFHVQPSNTAGGATITPAVQVEVQDLGGNRVTTANNTVSVAIGTNPSGGTLSGNAPVSALNGIAQFNLSIDKSGNGYTLTAASTGLTGATSTTFNITTGAATKLAFVQQPTSTTGGATITPAVTVEVEDAGGNRVTSATNSITVAIGTNPSNGTLGGLKTVAATSGLATFNNLSIDSAGTPYTLAASASGLTSATSNNFNITVGTASKLGFLVQPSNATGGATITPAVEVEIRDAGGNRVTTANNSVTVAIGTNPNSGTLGGLKTQAAAAGVATFSNLSIDSAGAPYTLTASATGLTGATSNNFTISVGAATKLGFRVPPSPSTGGVVISPAVQVEVRDAGGNRVTSATTSIAIALGTSPDPSAHLTGTSPVSAVGGVASFSDLKIDSAATGYTLVATGGGLTQATSNPFNIAVGPAAKLGFHIQPTNTVAGASITPAIQVEIEDAGGNRVTSGGPVSVGVAILNNAGGGTLSGTTPKNSSSGLATFNNISIDKTGTSYTLQATASGLTATTSTAFDITPAAADHLVFIAQPSNTLGGQTITPAVVVEVRDQFDNRVTGATTQITVDIGTNPGTPTPGTLAGTVVVNAVSGQATFGDLSIDNVGVGYTLTASAASLTGATSDPFDIL